MEVGIDESNALPR